MRRMLNYLKFISMNFKEQIKAFKYKYSKITSPESLVELHFKTWSHPQHINLDAFLKVFKILNGKPARILETGTSAWGTDSTRLWDKYVREYGGELVSIDIRTEPSRRLKKHLHNSTTLVVEDSVSALSRINKAFDVYFLDSYDLDLNNPLPSATHGYLEYLQIKDRLQVGNLIFIDDTPLKIDFLSDEAKAFVENYSVMPGKGAFVIRDLLTSFSIEVLHHDYCYLALIVNLTPRVKAN